MASAEMLRNKIPCTEGEIKKTTALSEITALKAKEEEEKKKDKCTIEMFCLKDNKNRKYLRCHRSNSYTDRVFQLGSVQERKLVVQ